jgi:hypothetical protein
MSDTDLKNVFEYKVAQRENKEATEGLERSVGKLQLKIETGVTRAETSYIDKVTGKDGWGEAAKTLLFGVSTSHDKAADAAHKHAIQEQIVSDKLELEASKAKEFSDKLDQMYASSFSVSEAQSKFNGDLTAFADKVRAAQVAGDGYATSLDESTTTGRENASMVRGLAKDILDTAKAASAQGQDVAVATASQRSSFASVLEQLGFNKAAAQKYADVLAGIPTTVDTSVSLDTSAAVGALSSLGSLMAQLGLTQVSSFLDTLSTWTSTTPQSVGAALAGQGPEAQAAADKKKSDAEQAQRDAEQRRRDAEQAARDEQQRRDNEQSYRYEFGGISAEDYKRYLENRLAQTRQFSDEWHTIWSEINQVNADIGAGWIAAQDQIRANEAEWMRVLAVQHEFGELSTADYLEQLKKRLAGLAMYSDEWVSTMREIQQLEDETSQSELAIQAAVEKQRLRDQAWYEGTSQRALSDARPLAIVHGGTSTTYSPTFQISTTDPILAGESANQKMRDYSSAVG